MSDKEYPHRDRFAFVSSGDAAQDAEIADGIIRREKRLIEGICPNGCAALVLDAPNERHCPRCQFVQWANVPFAPADEETAK